MIQTGSTNHDCQSCLQLLCIFLFISEFQNMKDRLFIQLAFHSCALKLGTFEGYTWVCIATVPVSLMCGSSTHPQSTQFFSPCSGIANCPQNLKLIATDPLQQTITFSWRAYKVKPKHGILADYECKVYYDEDIIYTELLPAFVTNYTILLQWEPKPSLPRAISISAISTIAIMDHTPPVQICQSGWNCTLIVLCSSCIYLSYLLLFNCFTMTVILLSV